MFCTKCGAEISENDQFCVKCGKENENYSAKELKKSSKKRVIFYVVPIILLAAILAIVVLKINKGDLQKSYINYSPQGIAAYVDENGKAIFFMDEDIKEFDDSVVEGCSTPDHSKFLLLDTESALIYRAESSNEKVEVAKDVDLLAAVSNTGCFYKKKDANLYFYCFETMQETEVGMKDCALTYSAGKTAVAGVDESGQLFVFSEEDDKTSSVCKMGDESSVCAISDDASNLIWVEKNKNLDIYMLKKNVPERIGTIINNEEYRFTYAYFFDQGKSFIVCSPQGTSVWISIAGGEAQEVSLPGVLAFDTFYDFAKNKIDSEDDSIKQFYFSVLNQKNEDIISIYRWTPNGEMTEVANDIEGAYYLVNGIVYYINSADDFCRKALNSDSPDEIEKITTDVDTLYVSNAGEYAYVVKSGNLYYVPLSDRDPSPELICTGFTYKDSVFTTDIENMIYYIADTEDIKYLHKKGTLYQYTIGTEPKKIADDICNIMAGDAKYYSSTRPIIRQYVSNDDFDFIFNIGTIEDTKFSIKVEKNMW